VRKTDLANDFSRYTNTASATSQQPTFKNILRTKIDIDDDLFAAIKQIAAQQKNTVAVVISKLLRQAISGSPRRPTSPAEADFTHLLQGAL